MRSRRSGLITRRVPRFSEANSSSFSSCHARWASTHSKPQVHTPARWARRSSCHAVIDRFAKDGDHDGKIDLWTDWPDIAESVAHYFVAHGWRKDEPVYADAGLENPDVEDLPGNKLDRADDVGRSRPQRCDVPDVAAGE
jgi:hypothetical protein